jgi:hypothetical protein
MSRQANPEVTANDIRILHDARDLIQTSRWQLAIDMEKPQDLPARDARAGIHLPATTAFALDKLITKSSGQAIRPIRASAIRDDNLSSGRSISQMLKKWPYQRRLVEYRNNDRKLHSERFNKLSLSMLPVSKQSSNQCLFCWRQHAKTLLGTCQKFL